MGALWFKAHDSIPKSEAGELSRVLQKGTLYILGLEDQAGGNVPTFYKIGITTDTVDKRIRQLQTGNPYQIIPLHTFDFEAAELVEGHLHRRFSTNRRILEWFDLSNDELDAVIQEAEDFAEEIAELAIIVRDLDRTPSDSEAIIATPEALDLHQEALRLEAEKTQNKLKKEIIRNQIEALVGISKGIPGIASIGVTKPKMSFKKALLKKEHPDLYFSYTSHGPIKMAMRIIGRAKPSDFPQLYEERVKTKAPRIEVDELEGVNIDRDEASILLHDSYQHIISAEGEVERDLVLVKMRLKAICGVAESIDGVCSYIREHGVEFDEDRFQADHPDLYNEFTTQIDPQRRLSVRKSRNY